MKRFRSIPVMLAASTLVSACAREKPPTDQAPAAVEQEAAPVAAAPTAVSKIGRMPMFDALAPEGRCSVRKFEGITTIVKELTYAGGYPERVVKLSLADSTRGFPMVNVDATVQREAGGGPESENLFVIFDTEGNVRSGTRTYTAPNGSGNERQGLSAGDSAQALRLAQQVMDKCRDAS